MDKQGLDAAREEKLRPGIEEALSFLQMDDRTLDVGSGDAHYLIPLIRRVSTGNVFAVDLSARSLALAEKWYTQRGMDGAVQLIQADAANLPFPDNHFRLVTNYGMLHGVPHPHQVLCEMMRVLKPGGLLVLFAFQAIDAQHWDELNADLQAHGREPLSIHPGFDPSHLVALLCGSGAIEANVRAIGGQTLATPPYTSRDYTFPGFLLTVGKR